MPMADRMNSFRSNATTPDRIVTTFMGGICVSPDVISMVRIAQVPVADVSASKAAVLP